MARILCAGLISVDLVFSLDAHPAKGSKARAAASHMIPGGGALNAASAIAGLGGRASLAGRIGDDELGGFLRRALAARAVDDRLVAAVPGVATARSAILVTPDGDRTIVNHRDAALMAGGCDLPPPFAFDAALVDTRWPQGAADILRAARDAGKPALVDAEAPVALAAEALDLASHVIFSEQGLADFAGSADAAGLAEAAARLGAWVAVTRGAAPVLCHDGAGLTEIAGFSVAARNTLGAGDVWHGAFALALAGGAAEPQAARHANAAAAVHVSRPVGAGAPPDADDVARLLGARPPPRPGP